MDEDSFLESTNPSPSAYTSGPEVPHHDGEFPTLVSHVCRHWRLVAISTPALWTSLEFAEGPPYEKSKTWVERSKDCDLDICIDFTYDDAEPGAARPINDLSRMLDIVAPQILLRSLPGSQRGSALRLSNLWHTSNPAASSDHPSLRSGAHLQYEARTTCIPAPGIFVFISYVTHHAQFIQPHEPFTSLQS